MNERIQELSEQAIKEVGPDDDDNGAKEKTLERFAELIVKECLAIMENCEGDLDFAIYKTKKDFGVE
jgi:hypothetical protein